MKARPFPIDVFNWKNSQTKKWQPFQQWWNSFTSAKDLTNLMPSLRLLLDDKQSQ
jgi:hypothetical protein